MDSWFDRFDTGQETRGCRTSAKLLPRPWGSSCGVCALCDALSGGSPFCAESTEMIEAISRSRSTEMIEAISRSRSTEMIEAISRSRSTKRSQANSLSKSTKMREANSDGSDSGCSGESSDDSPRGIKRSPEIQYNYEGLKGGRPDYQTMTINHNEEIMENAESLFSSQGSFTSSQQSFLDELVSSQPESLSKGLSVCKMTSSEKMYTHPYQASTRADRKVRNMEIQGQQYKPNKRITKRYQSELSSQETFNDKHEFSERDKQKALNRKYARDSRERKNQRMHSLEQSNRNQRSVIQIYTKAIAVYYKRLHRGEEPKWANRTFQWYNSKDGECGECQKVTCLLPIEDDSFYDELGNNTLGKIIEKKSDTEILISGTFSTCKTILSPAQHLVNKPYTTRFSPPVQRGYGQNQPTNVDSRDSRDDRQTRSENTVPFHTTVSELTPEVYEQNGQSELNSLHEAASHTPILSHSAIVITHSQQANSDIDNPSLATKSAKDIGIATATRLANTSGSFKGDSYMRATQASYKPCSVVAPDNMTADILNFSNGLDHKNVSFRGSYRKMAERAYWDYIKAPDNETDFGDKPDDELIPSLPQPVVFDSLNETDHKNVYSRGSYRKMAERAYWDYIKASDNETGSRDEPDDELVLSLPQAVVFDSLNVTGEPADVQRVSSVDNLQEDILDVEDLQSSLETA